MVESLQSLRGIFAILIFMSHVAEFSLGGDSGVCFFIILSGFVLCDGYGVRLENHQVSYASFMGRRLAKIYPLHLLCMLGAFVLTYSHPHDPIVWLANLLLLQSWWPDPYVYFSGNSGAWFLSVLMFCYAVFPFAVRLMCRSRRWFFFSSSLLLAAYFAAILFIPEELWVDIIYVNPLFRFVDFIIGMTLWGMIGGNVRRIAAEKEKRDGRALFLLKSLAEAGAVVLFLLSVAVYPAISPRYGLASFWWPSVIVVITVFSLSGQGGGIVSRLLRWRPLVSFGDISFSFYMLHILVIVGWGKLMAKLELAPPGLLNMIMTFLITLLLATLVSRYYEKPARRLLLRR